jgi:hypothetical protein
MTHVLQMSGVGDFRFYHAYDLWAGGQGDLSSQGLIEEHVGKVFAVQDDLGLPHLAPTVLLHAAQTNESVVALELARDSVRRDPSCRLAIAGTAPFWAGGAHLDAHVGALDALAPGGWFLTVVRTSTPQPAQAMEEEVHGLCRTVRALSESAPVHISHGDLAGLPAIAAGASTLGSGWDQRQRVCSYADYGPRDAGGGGGSWFQRPLLQGLLGLLSTNEATTLQGRNPALITRLGGLPAPAARETFDHHIAALHAVIARLRSQPDLEQRYRELRQLYTVAEAAWPTVQRITNCAAGAAEWIAPLANGLDWG